MAPNKANLITLASVLLLTSGCSGGRLRNLISRSDYQSLEELEQQDDVYGDRYGDDSDKARLQETSRTVSQQRELNEEEPSRFSISRLLKGKKPKTAFGEDPFLDPEIVESVTVRDLEGQAENNAKTAEARASKSVANPASQFSDTLSNVEKQAEDMFDDLSRATASNASSLDDAASSVEHVAEETTPTVTHSFADFMAKRAERQGIADPTPELEPRPIVDESPADPFALNSEPVEDERFDFDSLMSGLESEQDEPETAVDPASEPFPELETMFTERPSENEVALDSPAEDSAASAFELAMNSIEDETGDLTHDPYSLASQKHGFGPLGKQDPWAAFDSDVTGDEISWAVGSEKKDEETGFNWGQPPVSEYESAARNEAPSSSDSQFMQVASTTTSHDFAVEAESNSGSLVIPVPAQVAESGPSFTIPEPAAAPTEEDFFGSAEDFELAEVPVEETPGSAVSGSSGGLAAITGWPTRTWFFLLGCILVAVLLFLPNRQNQNNE